MIKIYKFKIHPDKNQIVNIEKQFKIIKELSDKLLKFNINDRNKSKIRKLYKNSPELWSISVRSLYFILYVISRKRQNFNIPYIAIQRRPKFNNGKILFTKHGSSIDINLHRPIIGKILYSIITKNKNGFYVFIITNNNLKYVIPMTGDVNYYKYLNSKAWKNKRIKIINMRRVCEKCGISSNLELHHLHYHSLGNESKSDLQLLCKRCHYLIHNNKGEK